MQLALLARTLHTRAKGVDPMLRSHARRFVPALALVSAFALVTTAKPALADGWHHYHHHYGYGWRGPGFYGWRGGPGWGWGGGPIYAPPPIVRPGPYYGVPAYPYGGYPYGYGGVVRPGVQLYFGPHFGVGF